MVPSLGGIRSESRTWALDVANDGAGLVVHELYADLGDTTTRTCRFPAGSAGRPSGVGGTKIKSMPGGPTGTAQNAGNFDKLDGGLGGIHCCD